MTETKRSKDQKPPVALDEKAEQQRGAALEQVTVLTTENKQLQERIKELENMLGLVKK